MRKVLLFSLIAATLFFADFFLKAYVHHFLPLIGWDSPFYPYGGIAVFENWCGIDFSINHVMNKGAAWGMLAAFHTYLFYARIVIIAALLVHLVFFAASSQKLPLLMIITGAFANVYDHIIYGHVIDMFYFRFWGHSFPVFNIADSAIFCGIVWLLILSFIKQRSRSASAHE